MDEEIYFRVQQTIISTSKVIKNCSKTPKVYGFRGFVVVHLAAQFSNPLRA
jgi:hypothetical protein